jgi:sugar lactone lactonase YvrE
MRAVKLASAALGLMIGALAAVPASAWTRGNVDVLFVLPDLVDAGNMTLPGVKSSVEGITVGITDNNIYAASSGTTNGRRGTPVPTGPANLFVIADQVGQPGTLVRQKAIGQASPQVLGLRFNPVTNALWALDTGTGQILNVDPLTGASSILVDASLFPANAFLNALTFDKAGNGYVTDSFNGNIYKIPSGGIPLPVDPATLTPITPWISDVLLKPARHSPTGEITPSVGANGIEFSPPGCDPTSALPCQLFVANTANRQIIQIPLNTDGTAGNAGVFINGINAPDGIAIDGSSNIWACANQEDEIVVIQGTGSTQGKVIAKLGDFNGIDSQGRVLGLLFPSSLAFSNDKNTLYVANFANPDQRAIDSSWARQVTGGYTVSKLSATIPSIPGQ